MTPQDILKFLRARPFIPFRIYMTDGRNYDVRHPDQALVTRYRVAVPLPPTDEVPEREEHLAIMHIVRIEELAGLAPAV